MRLAYQHMRWEDFRTLFAPVDQPSLPLRVWVDAPRSTVADFEVGERLMLEGATRPTTLLYKGVRQSIIRFDGSEHEHPVNVNARCTEATDGAEIKREQRNTKDLSVGDVFFLFRDSDIPYTIIAQGPDVHAWGQGIFQGFSEHENVWVEREVKK